VVAAGGKRSCRRRCGPRPGGCRSRSGRLAGIVTDGDLRRALKAGDDLLARDAGAVMTHNPRSIGPDTLAAEALRLMNESGITAMFVVDEAARPVGILHIHDLLRAGVA
jgi:arabinose-5-phosphate isomerase